MKLLFLASFLFPLLLQLIPTGSLANVGSLDPSVNLYISDQTTCSPLYYKQNGNWVQLFSIGPSGTLSCNGSQIDMNPAVVPTKNGMNGFTGLNTFYQLQLAPVTRPLCGQSNRGVLAFQNKGRGKDVVSICGSSGAGMKWMTIPLN